MTALEEALLEAIPTGKVRERTMEEVALCRVRTFGADSDRDVELADRLERANRRALRAWLESGRSI